MTLTASYERCRRLHASYGRSYYLATRLLPAWKRRHVHALYGYARYADEIVDSFTRTGDRSAALEKLARDTATALDGDPVDDPVLPAFAHTVRSFGIHRGDITAFLRAMRADLTVTRYATYADLLGYMEGSAAVIGTMMLPVLEAEPGFETQAREPARELGFAFQLTNFIRDIAEDLSRGRVYLPQEDLDAFGVTEDDLRRDGSGPAVRKLVAFEISRARDHYARALPGVELLVPSSRPCIKAAFQLYGDILTAVENNDHEVLAGRVRVPRRSRLSIFTRQLLASASAGRAERRVTVEVP